MVVANWVAVAQEETLHRRLIPVAALALLVTTFAVPAAVAAAPGEESDTWIVTLDPARGSVMKMAEIELPEGVATSIDAGLGTTFTVGASVRKDKDEVVVSWTFTRRHVGGVRNTVRCAAGRQRQKVRDEQVFRQ